MKSCTKCGPSQARRKNALRASRNTMPPAATASCSSSGATIARSKLACLAKPYCRTLPGSAAQQAPELRRNRGHTLLFELSNDRAQLVVGHQAALRHGLLLDCGQHRRTQLCRQLDPELPAFDVNA